MKTGDVTVSLDYRRNVGPRTVHGSVTLHFGGGDGFQFRSQARWPSDNDYTEAVERAVREMLRGLGALESTTCTLLSIDWNDVESCEAGFAAAARSATRSAFEV